MGPVTHDPPPRPHAGGRSVPLCPWVVTPSPATGAGRASCDKKILRSCHDDPNFCKGLTADLLQTVRNDDVLVIETS